MFWKCDKNDHVKILFYVKIKKYNSSLAVVTQQFDFKKNDLLQNILWCQRYDLRNSLKNVNDVYILDHAYFSYNFYNRNIYIKNQYQTIKFFSGMINLKEIKVFNLLRFECLMKFILQRF